MPSSSEEPKEVAAVTVERWECVRAWGQVLLCFHDANGETRIYALDRVQAAQLGDDLHLSSISDPEG